MIGARSAQVAVAVHTACSCGSHAGSDCQPSPPGSRDEVTSTSGSPIRAASVVANAARNRMPSAGTAT